MNSRFNNDNGKSLWFYAGTLMEYVISFGSMLFSVVHFLAWSMVPEQR